MRNSNIGVESGIGMVKTLIRRRGKGNGYSGVQKDGSRNIYSEADQAAGWTKRKMAAFLSILSTETPEEAAAKRQEIRAVGSRKRKHENEEVKHPVHGYLVGEKIVAKTTPKKSPTQAYGRIRTIVDASGNDNDASKYLIEWFDASDVSLGLAGKASTSSTFRSFDRSRIEQKKKIRRRIHLNLPVVGDDDVENLLLPLNVEENTFV